MAQTNGTNGHVENAICSVDRFLEQDYDFVVVGGGTAGLAVASRLTENPDITVGVLEAGKNRLGDAVIDTPAAFASTFNNPEYDWRMYTVPQKGNRNIAHHMPRGKLLGGSSGINYMMYVRGSEQDYNDWAELANDKGWNAEEMKKYMRKHQTLEPIEESMLQHKAAMPFIGENHGTSGPVRTSFNDYRLPIEDDVINAADEATGFDKKPIDPWSGDHIGFYTTLGTVVRSGPNRGKRSYAARGYLEPNLGRPNLKVLTEAHVSSVKLDGNTATGVNFIHNGQNKTVKARKEVIVSCGTIQSPQILELSGIGDPEVLKNAGVDCKVELPGVGANFQDHVVTATGHKLAEGVMSFDAVHKPEVMEQAQKMLVEGQGGPLTCIQSMQGFFPFKMFCTDEEFKQCIQSVKDTPTRNEFHKKQLEQVIAQLEDPKSANLQLVFVGVTLGAERGTQDQSVLWPPPSSPDEPMGITFALCLQYPASRGTIHITSSDPTKQPEIDPAYLQHPADVDVLAAGVKFLDKMANTKALKPKLAGRTRPEPNIDLQDTENARQSVRDWIIGEYHPCGTCSIGDVVDSRLKVKGVNGLRVCDASVFPNNVSGNIVSSVYAVAEKGADLIKEDWLTGGPLKKAGLT